MKNVISVVCLAILGFSVSCKSEAQQCPQIAVAQCFGTPQQIAACQQENQKRLDAVAKQCAAEQAKLGHPQAYQPPGQQNNSSQPSQTKGSYWYHGVNHAQPYFYEPSDSASQARAKSQCESAEHTACESAHGSAGPAL